MPEIGPSLVLAVVVGVFWTAFFVVLRGVAGGRLLFVFLLAVLGAWAGDALGGRLGIDLLRVGDFSLPAASVGAWAGIGLVVVIAVMGPARTPGGSGRPGR
jgi:hypothetical protein